jgi:hypothetical protein
MIDKDYIRLIAATIAWGLFFAAFLKPLFTPPFEALAVVAFLSGLVVIYLIILNVHWDNDDDE